MIPSAAAKMLNQKTMPPFIRELKQQGRWLPKRHLKSRFALLQTLSLLFQLVQLVKCWQILLEQNSKRLYQSSEKEKESPCLVFTSSTQSEIRHFHVVVVQWRQRNVQKRVVHVQSCCFAKSKPLLFCRSRCLSYLLFTSVPSQSTLRGCFSPVNFGLVRTTRSYVLWNLMLVNKLLVIDNCKFTASWQKKTVLCIHFNRSYKATDKINLKFNYQAEQFSIFLEFSSIPSFFFIYLTLFSMF